MRTVYTINPTQKRKKKKSKKVKIEKEGKQMKSKKPKRKSTRKSTTTTVYTNPSKKRRRYSAAKKRVKNYAKRGITGFNFSQTMKSAIPIQIGMFASKWAAKRWSSGGATETDPTSWKMFDYVKGALGGVLAGFLANMAKPGWGQKVFEGSFNLMLFKLIQNELVMKNSWAQGQFGEDYVPTEYLLTGGQGYGYGEDPLLFGQTEEDILWGVDEDGNSMPIDDRHRLPSITQDGYGDILVKPGPLGSVLRPVGHMGDAFSDRYNM